MSVGDALPWLTGSGGCIIALTLGIWLFVTGKIIPKGTHDAIVRDKDQQIQTLVASLGIERQRSDAATLAAKSATDVLSALERYRPPSSHREE